MMKPLPHHNPHDLPPLRILALSCSPRWHHVAFARESAGRALSGAPPKA